MKRYFLVGMLLFAALGSLKAQDCEALVLPYFNNDRGAMSQCPADKIQYYCFVAKAAFYESDTVPAGAEMHNISEVKDIKGSNHLSQNFVVDMNTLSYFAYNFEQFQLRDIHKTICFYTPSSKHPYLVLRSYYEMYDIAVRNNNELHNR